MAVATTTFLWSSARLANTTAKFELGNGKFQRLIMQATCFHKSSLRVHNSEYNERQSYVLIRHSKNPPCYTLFDLDDWMVFFFSILKTGD